MLLSQDTIIRQSYLDAGVAKWQPGKVAQTPISTTLAHLQLDAPFG